MSDAGGIVVIAAMPRELRPLARRLRLRPAPLRGLPAWRGDGLVAVAVGVGPARAAARAAEALDDLAPARVLVIGVAGALDPGLDVGDLVHPSAVIDVRTARELVPHGSGERNGVLATVEEVWCGHDPSGKAPRLPAGATAVDMETAAIAALAEERGLPWDVVRAISDVAGTLTPELAALLRPDGRVDVRASMRLVLRDPRMLARLIKLGVDTAGAVRVATRVVATQLSTSGSGWARTR